MDQLLDNHPKKLRAKMPSEKDLLLKLANSLDFIHSRLLVHGDIRPENVLIFTSNRKTATVKWTGFGLFKTIDKHGRFKVLNENQAKGNLRWMAPEMLQVVRQYSAIAKSPVQILQKESDVFSAGCLFFFYLTGAHPFGHGENIVDNILFWDRVNAMG